MRRRIHPVARRRPGLTGIIALLLLGLSALAALAATSTVVQKARSFSVKSIELARGDTLAFANQDDFIHQIYVESPTMTFDSAEQNPGDTINVTFDKLGTFQVRCHIHPKMALTVAVK